MKKKYWICIGIGIIIIVGIFLFYSYSNKEIVKKYDFINLIKGGIVSANLYFVENSSFVNGTYSNTTFDIGNFVRLDNASKESPNSQAYNSSTNINMTGNILLLHLNDDGYYELPNNQATSNGLNMTGNVLLMHMNDGWKDSSKIGNNGTAVGGVAFTTSSKLGNASGSFDVVDDFINITLSTNLQPRNENFTISAWFKAGTSSATQNIYWNYMEPTAKVAIGVAILNDGRAYGLYRDAQGDKLEAAGGSYNDNKWHQMVWVRNTTSVGNLYVDSVLLSSVSNTTVDFINGTSSMVPSIGANVNTVGTASGFLNGSIDEVAIWNRSLSASEIQTLYENTAPKFIDNSGFSNNGTGQGNINTSISSKLGNHSGSFDGVEDFISMNDATSNNIWNKVTTEFTVSAWVNHNLNATAISVYPIIIEKDPLGGATNRFMYSGISITTDKFNLNIFNYTGSPKCVIDSTTSPRANTWYLFTYSFNASGCFLYVNGVKENSSSTVPTLTINNGYATQVSYSGSNAWNGTIDEFTIWNRSLSNAEILNIYQQQYGKYYEIGTYTSEITDLGSNQTFNNISWINTTLANTILNVSVRSCNDALCSGESWNGTYSNNIFTDISDLLPNQYFQYFFNFKSNGTGDLSPKLYNVTMDYSAYFVDTCTCSPINTNWVIALSDYCIISIDCNIGEGNITWTGTGNISFNANITANNIFGLPANQVAYIGAGEKVIVG